MDWCELGGSDRRTARGCGQRIPPKTEEIFVLLADRPLAHRTRVAPACSIRFAHFRAFDRVPFFFPCPSLPPPVRSIQSRWWCTS